MAQHEFDENAQTGSESTASDPHHGSHQLVQRNTERHEQLVEEHGCCVEACGAAHCRNSST